MLNRILGGVGAIALMTCIVGAAAAPPCCWVDASLGADDAGLCCQAATKTQQDNKNTDQKCACGRVGLALEMVNINGVTELTISGVVPGAPGEKAGLLVGDEIVAVNGGSVSELRSEKLTKVLTSGQPMKLKIERDGSLREVVVTPESCAGSCGTSPTVVRELVSAPGQGSRESGPRIGEPAPEIAGEDTDGVPFVLSDYRGKVVVLVFWGFW